MDSKRIGIMGGTFDPIHFGHLVIANEVLDQYHMEKIIFIPAGNPPHKKDSKASSIDRYIMTNLATLSNDKFEVSNIELIKKEKSYTINTLLALREIYKDAEVYFITGADAIIELPNWYEFKSIIKLCKFIAVTRPDYNTHEIKEKIQSIIDIYQGQIELLKVPMLQISSTEIRNRIKNNRTAKYLLPEVVEQYIVKNNLYGDNNE